METQNPLIYPLTIQQKAALLPPKDETHHFVVQCPIDYRKHGSEKSYLAFIRHADDSYELIDPQISVQRDWQKLSQIAHRASFTVRGSIKVKGQRILPEQYVALWDQAFKSPYLFSELRSLHGLELAAEITGPSTALQNSVPCMSPRRHENFAAFAIAHGKTIDTLPITRLMIDVTSQDVLEDIMRAGEVVPYPVSKEVTMRWHVKKVGTSECSSAVAGQLELQV